MGIFQRTDPRPPPPHQARAAAVTGRDVVATRLAGFVTPTAATLTRDAVWTVPGVAAGLQVIAGTIGTLPLVRRDRTTHERVELERGFLDQLDPTEPTSSTLTRLVEDLVLYPCGYLAVIARYATGYPQSARYVPFESVTPPDDDQQPYRVEVNGQTVFVPQASMLRFPSPTPGLITTAGRTIETALSLEHAARRLADADLPSGVLKNSGADLSDDQISELLTQWETARRTRTTAYLNQSLAFDRVQWDAAELQLVAGREFQVADIARHMNLPSRFINAPQAAQMTYSTVEGQRRELVDTSLRPYIVAVESRLSMNDVCPITQEVRFELSDFLRGSATERMAVAAQRIAAGMTSPQEERTAEGIPGQAPRGCHPAAAGHRTTRTSE